MNTVQRILKNFLSLTFANLFTSLLGVVTVTYLARILGPQDFGKINFALAVVNYFAIFSHFGLNTIGTREIARNKEKINDYVGNILTLKLCLGTIAYLLLLIFVFFINKPLDIKYLIILYGFTIFTTSVLLLDWVFQGIEEMKYVGISLVLQAIFYLGTILSVIRSSEHLLYIPGILVFSQLLQVLFLFFIFTKNFRLIKMKFDLNLWKFFLKESIPISLTGIPVMVIYNTGIVVLGILKSAQETGYFSGAYKLILLFGTVVAIYSTAIFPAISFYYKNSKEVLSKFLNYSIKLVLIFCLPITVGCMILAKPIITLIYGSKYLFAAIIFQFLILNVIPRGMDIIFSQTLWATDQQKEVLRISCIQAVWVLINSLILTKLFGVIGTSIAFITGEFIAFPMYYYKIKKITDVSIHKYLLKPLIASVSMGLFLLFCPKLDIFSSILLGATIYFLVLFTIKGINFREIQLVFQR